MKERTSLTMPADDNILRKGPPPPLPRVALLWDESYLWAVMSYRALRSAGLGFEFIRCSDIREGKLDQFAVLFVPGGWASNKMKALKQEGIDAIRKFVQSGGHYIGFCGGAGLATQDGIGLLDIARRPTRDRVPSFSGRVFLNTALHVSWKDVSEPIFHAWWPSQFVINGTDLKILATYGKALPDAFSSDLNVGDISRYGDWDALERLYGINLDPGRLISEPAVVEGSHGKGRVILSLVHFDTPGDANGSIVLRNLWQYLAGPGQGCFSSLRSSGDSNCDIDIFPAVREMRNVVSELIDFGARNFLWFWRNPMLLQWRRGVRGLEYCTLYVLANEIAFLSQGIAFNGQAEMKLLDITQSLASFVEKAKKLLMLERSAISGGHITYEACDIPEIQSLRKELFSTSKSHGGLFKELISELDELLLSLNLPHQSKLH